MKKKIGRNAPARHNRRRLATALGAAAVTWAGPGLAQDAAQTGGPLELGPITVEGLSEGSYRTDRATSPKFTAPLLDTPQTATVIPQPVIREQGARNLTEVLENTPGISFNAGENGFASSPSNNFMLRGFEASGNVFFDGARDAGSYSRDIFNVEQVEVFKGPAADNGRGAPGGYVNLVTKSPRPESFVSGEAGIGFDEYGDELRRRTTLDVNHVVTDHAAMRLNLLLEDSGVPGREVAETNVWGIAPSLALGLGTSLRGVLSLEHVARRDLPDWGVPGATFEGVDTFDPTAAGAPREAFYGLRSDHDDVDATALLARLEYDISDRTTISNQTRWAQVDRNARFTVPTNYDPMLRQATTSTLYFDQLTETITNLTNLTTRFETGSIAHTLSAGLDLTRESSDANRVPNNDPGNADIFDPDPDRSGGVPAKPSEVNAVQIDTAAVYAYDTIELTERWQITGGLRAEQYYVEIDSRTVAGAPAGAFDGYDDSKFSLGGKVGLVYKPAPNGSVYGSFGVATLPPGSFLSNADISRTGDNAFPGFVPDAKGIRSYNYEIGTKWDLMGGRLSTTAAVFRTEKRNVPVTGLGPGETEVTLKGYHEQIVQGIEIGIAGEIVEGWKVFAGAAYLDSERRIDAELDAARRRANPNDYGGATRTDGDELAFTPQFTANLWTTYRFPFGLTVGGGVQFVDEQQLGRPDDALRIIPNGVFGELDSYTLVHLMASYELTENVDLRLNIDNVFDEEYAISSNWNGRRVFRGAPRTFLVSTSFRF